MGSITDLITTLGKNASIAAKTLRGATTEAKNNALINTASQIDQNRKNILEANQQDLAHGKDNGLDDALLDDSCSTMLDLMALSKA